MTAGTMCRFRPESERHVLCVVEAVDLEAQTGRVERKEEVYVERSCINCYGNHFNATGLGGVRRRRRGCEAIFVGALSPRDPSADGQQMGFALSLTFLRRGGVAWTVGTPMTRSAKAKLYGFNGSDRF